MNMTETNVLLAGWLNIDVTYHLEVQRVHFYALFEETMNCSTSYIKLIYCAFEMGLWISKQRWEILIT